MVNQIAITIVIAFFFVGAAGAQQTIFNVPSPDILGRGKVYVELDGSFKPADQMALSRFSSFVPRLVVGVGSNVEVGLNVTGNIQPGADSTAVVPTVKWRFYQNEKSGVAIVAGTDLFIPVRNRTYDIGTYWYLSISKTLNKTRLTGGVYVASKNVFAPDAVRGGGQFGIEQVVSNKFSVAADWITGKHSSGFFTPGFIYKPTTRLTTYWAYSIGNANASAGNHFFLFEAGYNFN
jgi:hypothetical protein